MSKHEKSSEPRPGEGPSRHKGRDQHGWSPDVDEAGQKDNPSAHRSFHPDEHAAKSGPGRTVSKEETQKVTDTKGETRRGEKQADRLGRKDMQDTGPQGRSQRPSGSRHPSARTGINPEDPPSDSR
ncbi:hypothetical protein ABT112_26380 [Streptomyces sp. NPDC002055]|uniref:hypothetical protein n=1 Tax=Streptomyces sp. NPDC002055 TaxID=3154534 RepID=UPI0033201B8F